MTIVQTPTFESVASDETPFCGHCHHRDEIAGYVVVLTAFGRGKVRDAALFVAPAAYGSAVELAQHARAAASDETDWDYARIDVLYSDGCRGIL